MVFGGGNNLIRDTAEVFVENAEKGAAREAVMRGDALAQFAGEFAVHQRGLFDRFMDALNRIPRPAMAIWRAWVVCLHDDGPDLVCIAHARDRAGA